MIVYPNAKIKVCYPKDFAELAENSSEVDIILNKIDELYQLDIIGGYNNEF